MPELDKSNDSFMYHYSIEGIDAKQLHYVKVAEPSYLGGKKWYLIDALGNTTEMFDNYPDIIPINKTSCIFVGAFNGNSKLFYAHVPKKSEKMYRSIDLPVSPKSIIRYDDKYVIINSYSGQLFFDKTLLRQSSDVFDAIRIEEVEGKKVPTFEKSAKYNELTKTIIGVVTPDGKIGTVVHDSVDQCLKTTPKIKGKQSFDKLDIDKLNEIVKECYTKRLKERQETIRKLVRVNMFQKNDK